MQHDYTLDARFLFIATYLVLDFVNTEIVVRRRRVDLLESPEDLAAWWGQVQHYYPDLPIIRPDTPPLFDADLLAAARDFRGALRHIATLLTQGQGLEAADLAPLNSVLGQGAHTLEPLATGRPRVVYQHSGEPALNLLLPIALAMFDLLANADLSRLRHCRNEHCILFFYDTTKNGTREWCSVGCMNRHRSSENYRRAKGG